MLILVVQQWKTLFVDWQHGTNVTKNFISVCHFFHVARSYKCWLKNMGLAKVVKHCINKKKCSYGTCCTGTAKKLVIFVFCNSTKSRKVGVALELRLLEKSVSSFQLENDCMNWCLLVVYLPAKILLSQILHNQIKKHADSFFFNVSPDARLIVTNLVLYK